MTRVDPCSQVGHSRFARKAVSAGWLARVLLPEGEPAPRPRDCSSERLAILGHVGKTLYLLRHAKSSWDDPSLADRDRPLAPRGRRASKTIAGYLQRQAITPSLVLCSSSRRTRETLEQISAALGKGADVRIEESLYATSATRLLKRLRTVDSRVSSVMMIGHDPAIKELALNLAGSGRQLERLREKFPTGALATLAFRGSWSDLRRGTTELVAFVKPRELEHLPSDVA